MTRSVLIYRTCGHCQHVQQVRRIRERIGDPLLLCKFCGQMFFKTGVNEWEFLTDNEQSLHIIAVGFRCIFYLILVSVFAAILNAWGTPLVLAILVVVLGGVISFALSASHRYRVIKSSIQRTSDPNYFAKLHRIAVSLNLYVPAPSTSGDGRRVVSFMPVLYGLIGFAISFGLIFTIISGYFVYTYFSLHPLDLNRKF